MWQLEVSACGRTQDSEGLEIERRRASLRLDAAVGVGPRQNVDIVAISWEEGAEASAPPSKGDIMDMFAYDDPS